MNISEIGPWQVKGQAGLCNTLTSSFFPCGQGRILTLHISKSGDIFSSELWPSHARDVLLDKATEARLHKVVTHVLRPCWAGAGPLGLPRWELGIAKMSSCMHWGIAIMPSSLAWMKNKQLCALFEIRITMRWMRKAVWSKCTKGVARRAKGIHCSHGAHCLVGQLTKVQWSTTVPLVHERKINV